MMSSAGSWARRCVEETDVDDLVTVAHAEAHRLLCERVQLRHRGQGGIAHVQAPLDQIAKLQQPHAQPVATGLGAVHKASGCQVVEDAVRGGRVQAGFFTDVFEADGLFTGGEYIDQGEHALNHLYRWLTGNV